MADLEEKLDSLKLENELLSEQAKEAEMKALIKDLKAKYGNNWRSLLKFKDNESLKQFGSTRFKLV